MSQGSALCAKPTTGKIIMQKCVIHKHTDNHKVQQIKKAEADDQEFFIGSIQAEKHDHPVSQINTVDA